MLLWDLEGFLGMFLASGIPQITVFEIFIYSSLHELFINKQIYWIDLLKKKGNRNGTVTLLTTT